VFVSVAQKQNSNSNCAPLKFALMLPFVLLLLLGQFVVARVLLLLLLLAM